MARAGTATITARGACKRRCFEPFYTKNDNLSRQARDKHRETLKQRFVFRRSDYINHVYDTLDGQLAGQLWWSVDVGGFFCQMDEETLARDFMLSATAPIMRQVMKRFLFSHFYIKTIMLPRQPRDEHKENSKTDRFLAARRS